MLSGLGLLGENFFYPGHLDSNFGFSRFPGAGGSGGSEGLLHPLHMSHNVTMDECDLIVERHQLLAPHGVWMVKQEHEDGFASAERLGDCGLFLGARSSADADVWRAFYRYARMILRLGHVDTWLDDDIMDAVVHSSAETACNSATSKVCLWWAEFDLDDEEYSCRPKRDASNIVTPSILLATLAENRVNYPPPLPPPPMPPASPPASSPPPGAIRCELSGVASTSGHKVAAWDFTLGRNVPVQQKCWRWDPGNQWPPFVAHRDIYVPRDRCSGARSRDIQWDNGFRQSLIGKDAFDPLYQNNNDCPYKARVYPNYDVHQLLANNPDDGGVCSDGHDDTASAADNENPRCEIGTNLDSCGVRKNLVVFGYAFLQPFVPYNPPAGTDNSGELNPAFYEVAAMPGGGSTYSGLGELDEGWCVRRGTGAPLWGKKGQADFTAVMSVGECRDGGPGSTGDECFYGTDQECGRRRFAFALEDAGPDVPDNSCTAGTTLLMDGSGHNYGPNNGICEDGLMWSWFPPGKNPCAPNTDRSDCGYRPPKRPVRLGKITEDDTCDITPFTFNPTTDDNPAYDYASACYDYSDDLLHSHDPRMRWGGADAPDAECGRGTQTRICKQVAEDTIKLRLTAAAANSQFLLINENDNKVAEVQDGPQGSLAYTNHRYHDKATYINRNLVGRGGCSSPTNLLHDYTGNLVKPRMWHSTRGVGSKMIPEYNPALGGITAYTIWYGDGDVSTDAFKEAVNRLRFNIENWKNEICSDGGPGSVRIPFEAGPGRDSIVETSPYESATQKYFFDFGCPYGSQPGVCPDREGLEEYQETMDEMDQPSGPAFSNCHDEGVPDFECCHATHEFRIHGGGGKVGNTGVEQLEYCALTDTSLADGDPCPAHFTSYHHTTPQCESFCREAFQREGNDNTCMPAKPECANWLKSTDFPSEQYVTVDAECICGAKLENLQPASKYVHTGTVLQGTRARERALHEDGGVDGDMWEWPDPISVGIDQFHGETPITSLKHAHARLHTCTLARLHACACSPKHTRALSTAGPIGWLHVSPFFLVCRRAL